MKRECCPNRHKRNDSGSATVETLLVMTCFASAMVFASVQFALLSVTSLVSADAAAAAARSASVSGDISGAQRNALLSGSFVFSAALNVKDSVPAGNPVKEAVVRGGTERSRSGRRIFTVLVGQRYLQRLMFPSLIMPFLGESDAFIVSRPAKAGAGQSHNPASGGMGKQSRAAGRFFSGGTGVYSANRACAAVISPDPEFYFKGYPGAKKWQ